MAPGHPGRVGHARAGVGRVARPEHRRRAAVGDGVRDQHVRGPARRPGSTGSARRSVPAFSDAFGGAPVTVTGLHDLERPVVELVQRRARPGRLPAVGRDADPHAGLPGRHADPRQPLQLGHAVAGGPGGRPPYRVVQDASRPAKVFRLSTRTHTEWTFMSDTVDSDYFEDFSVLQLDYDLETNLRGDIKGGQEARDRRPVGALAGRNAGSRQGHEGDARPLVRRRAHLAQGRPGPEPRLVARLVQGPRQARSSSRSARVPGRPAPTASSRRSSGPTACDEGGVHGPEATPGSPDRRPVRDRGGAYSPRHRR